MNKVETKIFFTLFFSLFVSLIGVGIVVPLLPLYASKLGASGLYIGMIFGSFSLSRSLFLPYFGSLSDRKGRKPFIIIGLFGYTIVSLAYIYSKSVESIIVIRFFHGIASAMLMPIIQAYIGDISSEGKEGYMMGMFNTSLFLGLSIGPILGGIINEKWSLTASFLSMTALSTLGLLLSLILLPPRRSEKILKVHKPLGWKILFKDKEIIGFFFLRFGYVFCIGMIWGFMPVFATKEFYLTSSQTGILLTLGVFISGSMQTPMGLLADKFNKVKMASIGGYIISIAIISFQWSKGFWTLFLSNIFFGIGGGIAMPSLMALSVMKGKKLKEMGSVMGILTMAHSLGMMAGAIIAGMMMDIFELKAAFAIATAVMFFCVNMFIWCVKPADVLV
ncbi:MAG: MFS transporter [Desulfobacterales bacterium]|nr:MFS transporter [Desulfobacterales bacterium]